MAIKDEWAMKMEKTSNSDEALKKAAAYYAWVTPGNDETKAFIAGAEWMKEKLSRPSEEKEK